MRKRTLVALALAASAIPLAAFRPAAAHGPTIVIAGFQFAHYTLFESGGLGGYVGTPAGAVPVDQEAYVIRLNGAHTNPDDSVDEIQNRDALPHTFSQCTDACDTANGISACEDPDAPAGSCDFNIRIPGGTATEFTGTLQPDTTYTVMCLNHRWMRAKLVVGG